MFTVSDINRICPECGDTGLINMGPTYRNGPSVHERCDCQPKQTETDQDYYARRAAIANDEADRLMALRETSARQTKIAAE